MSGQAAERARLREEAEQRLIEAALREVVPAERAATSGGAAARTRRSSWLVAAALVLGSAVVVALSWTEIGRDEAVGQDPRVLPPAISVSGAEELLAVDVGAEHVELAAAGPEDLEGLARLKSLRAVSVRWLESVPDDKDVERGWSEAGREALAALSRCRRLERVSIGYLPGMDPRACEALGALPALVDVELIGVQQLVDRDLVSKLSRAALRRVSLIGARIAPEGFAALCELPLLESLDLQGCLHLARCDLTALGRLRQLRELSLRGVGGRFADSMSKTNPLPGEQAVPEPEQGPVIHTGFGVPGDVRLLLTPPVMRAIAGLPRLRALSLRSSVVDDAALAALPDGLEDLHLGVAIGLTPAAVRGLSRLKQLRRLGWSSIAVDAPPAGAQPDRVALEQAWVQAISGMELHGVSYHGGVDGELAAALGAQRSLRSLELVAAAGEAIELVFVAALPLLAEVTLTNFEQLDPAPFERAAALRRVEVVRGSESVVAALRRTFVDARVELIVRP